MDACLLATQLAFASQIQVYGPLQLATDAESRRLGVFYAVSGHVGLM